MEDLDIFQAYSITEWAKKIFESAGHEVVESGTQDYLKLEVTLKNGLMKPRSCSVLGVKNDFGTCIFFVDVSKKEIVFIYDMPFCQNGRLFDEIDVDGQNRAVYTDLKQLVEINTVLKQWNDKFQETGFACAQTVQDDGGHPFLTFRFNITWKIEEGRDTIDSFKDEFEHKTLRTLESKEFGDMVTNLEKFMPSSLESME